MATVHIDDDLVAIIQAHDKPLDQVVHELIVIALYHHFDISGGRATELLGMDRLAFIHRAPDLGIPYFRMTTGELEAEFRAADEIGRPSGGST